MGQPNSQGFDRGLIWGDYVKGSPPIFLHNVIWLSFFSRNPENCLLQMTYPVGVIHSHTFRMETDSTAAVQITK